jgi:type 2 lantibiotic biosynthesis protein LanM
VSGVALFLGYLGHLTGEARYSDLSRAAIDGARRQLKGAVDKGAVIPGGGFSGVGGGVYVMSQLATLWRDASYLDDAEALLSHLSATIAADDALDLIGGSAGLLLSAASLNAARRSAVALDVVARCAARLVERAVAQEVGTAWNTSMNATRPLLGLSHGASGMAVALAEAARITGRSELMDLAHAAAAYERSRYSPTVGNWPDYRILDAEAAPATEDRFMNAWCHGAPGIGLARVRMLAHGPDAALEQDLAAAGECVRREGLIGNQSLCHGDLGNSELLLALHQRDAQWTPIFMRTTAAILDGTQQFGWRCGIPTAVESPGFMAGLAGIGYGFLRLAHPDRVPSALTLEAPRP